MATADTASAPHSWTPASTGAGSRVPTRSPCRCGRTIKPPSRSTGSTGSRSGQTRPSLAPAVGRAVGPIPHGSGPRHDVAGLAPPRRSHVAAAERIWRRLKAAATLPVHGDRAGDAVRRPGEHVLRVQRAQRAGDAGLVHARRALDGRGALHRGSAHVRCPGDPARRAASGAARRGHRVRHPCAHGDGRARQGPVGRAGGDRRSSTSATGGPCRSASS